MNIEVPLRVFRYSPGSEPHLESYTVSVPEDAYVIDAIEAVWAQHDRDFGFRHACHHASCGSCAVRINGYEKLPCIVTVKESLAGRSEILVEPLRNFPLVKDLVVDVAGFFGKQEASGMIITRPVEPMLNGAAYQHSGLFDLAGRLQDRVYDRFQDCVECGICMSACPTMSATDSFLGPAPLAGIHRAIQTADPAERARLLDLADSEHGVWQCHSAWECTESCPQSVNPAEAIMALRRTLVGRKLRRLLGGGNGAKHDTTTA